MAMTIHCDIVSAEEEIFSGLVETLVATGQLGELGVSPRPSRPTSGQDVFVRRCSRRIPSKAGFA